jgi:hypothetical protein
MIDMRRDLFARLVISSHKDKGLNRPFRVVHVDDWKVSSRNFLDSQDSDGLEEELSRLPLKDFKGGSVKIAPIISSSPKAEKIDEKIDSIVNDPVLIEVQIELEFAEQLLVKIKDMDKHNPKIPIIEDTILKLRSLLNQKMYI